MASSRRGIVAIAATLLLTSLVGRLPQAMSALAIVRLVLDAGGDYGLASGLTAAYVLASTVGQPILASAVDRTGRPRLIIVVTAVAAGIALVVLAVSSTAAPAIGFIAALVAGLATPPLEPVLRSLWPRLMTRGPQLTRAFSADAAVQEVIFIVGPLTTAIAIALIGSNGAVVLMGALGLIGAVAFVTHRELGLITAAPRRAARAPGERASLRAVLSRTAMSVAAIRRLTVAQVAAGLPIGVLTISASSHADVVADPALSGIALAVSAGGALVGALLIARFPLRIPPTRAVALILVVFGVLYLPTAAIEMPSAYWLAAAFVSGVALPPFLTQIFAAVELASPRAQLTEANAWTVSGLSIGIAAGTLGAGLGAQFIGIAGVSLAVLIASAIAIVTSLVVRPSVLTAAVDEA